MGIREKIEKSCKEYGVYFIAEIGQNHQGQLSIAKEMVRSLLGTGVSAIKTAKRDIDTCLTEEQKVMPYDNPNSFGKTYYEHRKALELEKSDFVELIKFSKSLGFDFISSYTDINSLKFLVDQKIDALKIASQRLADVELMNTSSRINLPFIISTGMSSQKEVDRIVKKFSEREKYILQCTSTYPCPLDEIDLNVITTYKERYYNKIDGVGFSGHHTGIAADIGAYMLGSKIIERHYTLDRSMRGTDHSGSLELKGIEYILKYIKQIKTALGSSKKILHQSEKIALNKLRGDLLKK
jgi:sialic acid synthase SpsE